MESNQEQNESSKIDQQIKMIREEKQRAYNNYVRTKESAEDYKLENQKFQELREKRIMCLTNLRYKYLYMSDPKIMAVKKIQNFLREKYFEPRCVNDDEIAKIPSLYRLRINITNHHINEYSENNIEPELLDMHRIIYKMVEMSEQKYILFRYCFDIRKLYPMRNDLIELYDGYFFMQPDDHIRINELWNKVNGETRSSIKYLSEFEYWKSISKDSHDQYQNILIPGMSHIRNEVEKIIDLDASNNNNQKIIYWK